MSCFWSARAAPQSVRVETFFSLQDFSSVSALAIRHVAKCELKTEVANKTRAKFATVAKRIFASKNDNMNELL